MTRDTNITLGWDEIGMQGLVDHAVSYQDFHGDIVIGLEQAKRVEICHLNRTSLFC